MIAERRATRAAHFSTRTEVALVAAVLGAIFATYLVRLTSVVLSDMDEGTYLYAAKLMVGGAVPYRDFLLAHPPLAVILAAGWQRLAGPDIMPARLAYATVVLISTTALYAIARRLSQSVLTGLLAIVTYTAGMLLLANMGRTIRLEPLMNAFLIAGYACHVIKPLRGRFRALAGALFAAALLVKLVAAVPIVLVVLADMFFRDRRAVIIRVWLSELVGGAVILLPAAAILLTTPGFIDDVVVSQVQRGALPLTTRLFYLWQDFARYPVIPVALGAGLWWLIRRSSDPHLKATGFVAIASTLSLVLLFRTFFGYYLVQVLPWIAILFAMMLHRAVRLLPTRQWHSATVGALIIGLGLLVPLGYAEYYYRTARDHGESPANIVGVLRQSSGYIYSMYPSFALQSGRDEYPWYYAADALIPRMIGKLTTDDLVRAFSGSQAVVLFAGELENYPAAGAFVAAHFHQEYADPFFSVWTRD